MVMAIGSGSGWWPEASAGVLDNGNPPMGSRPAGHSDEREHQALCDGAPQISMEFKLGVL
jgi:hypothetical protein